MSEHDADGLPGDTSATLANDGPANDGPANDGPASEREPVTRRSHDASWSANLEGPRHARDRELVVAEAIEAVEATASGYHVNLVTHGEHGDPREYLWAELGAAFDAPAERIECEYVDQCGCGGHVTRVHVE